jgi:hypothetical protein
LLQIGAFFGENSAFYRANLETNATINAGGKVNPVPIRAFCIFAGTRMNAGDGTGINAIGNAFAGISDNRMGHGKFLTLD